VNSIRKRENAKQRGVVPLTNFLAIIERTSHQSAALMAAAADAPAHMATSLVMDAASLDSGVSQAFRPSVTSGGGNGGGVGTLNSGTVFGFTLFALGLRPQDSEWILGLLREQMSLDLFTSCVEHARRRLDVLRAEEATRGLPGGYLSDAQFTSLLQSSKLLLSEVQDTSYEMNVIKEWLASTAVPTPGAAAAGDPDSVASASSANAAGAASQRHKQYFVLHKSRFNTQLTQLLRDVMRFGQQAREARLGTIEALTGAMESALGEARGEMKQRAKQLHGQLSDFTARALAQVTDSQFQLVLQLQQMREQLTALQAYVASLEPSLRREVAAEYDGKTHRLQLQLLHLRSKLDINSLSIRARILAHYYGLKRSALEEMITKGSAPYPIKQRALGLLNSEAAFQAAKEEFYALSSTARKLDALFGMKEASQARLFAAEQDRLAALVEEHQALERRIAACETRTALFEREMAETKNTLLSARKYEAEMQRLFLMHRRDNARLNAWKRAQLARLARLESVSSAFDDVSLSEFDRVESELRARAEEMETALQYETAQDVRKQMAKAAQDKKMRQIRRLIQREDKLIQEANMRIQSAAIDASAVASLDPTWQQRDNDAHWEQRCIVAEKKALSLRAENDRLRRRLNSQPTNAEEWKLHMDNVHNRLQLRSAHSNSGDTRAAATATPRAPTAPAAVTARTPRGPAPAQWKV